MGYTLGEAARATGLNKSSILKALKTGKVSGTKDEHGQWCIEPCELHRVYPARSEDNGAGNGTGNDGQPTDNGVQQALALAEARLGDLKAMLNDMRSQRDDMREQRDAWQRQAEASQRALTDQREKPEHQAEARDEPSRLRRAWRWMRATGCFAGMATLLALATLSVGA
jgi:hypothetical protein